MEQTKISAKVIADSKNEFGNRITTFELTYPRIIHAEFMTHRMFSRNAASSRAVPVKKMIESIKNNMFTPLGVQKAHKGMQGKEYFSGEQLKQANQLWIESAKLALQQAEKMEKLGITKQIINRILEPYQYYKVLVTSTSFENFFNLRCPKYTFHKEDENDTAIDTDDMVFKSRKEAIKELGSDEIVEYEEADIALKNLTTLDWLKLNTGQSEIHMMALAEAMYDAYQESVPKELKVGEWHLPYSNDIVAPIEDLIKICVAKCARVSYTTVGENKESNYENDFKLYDKLLESGHWSPFEHCAMCQEDKPFDNFNGFQSFRNKY